MMHGQKNIKLQILVFMKIVPLGAETGGQTEVKKLIIAFRIFAKAPEKLLSCVLCHRFH